MQQASGFWHLAGNFKIYGYFRLPPVARSPTPDAREFIPYYCGDFEKYPIFATNFSYKIMSNLLIISSFNLKL
jgi:hypothetical protein